MEYIRAAKQPTADEGCIFCDLPHQGDDAKALILARAEHAFVLLNSFPYNPGHVMVAPFQHTPGVRRALAGRACGRRPADLCVDRRAPG